MKKNQLLSEIDLDFSLVGISCHHKDYRFVWLLNKALQSDFTKTNQPQLHNNDCFFSQFRDARVRSVWDHVGIHLR